MPIPRCASVVKKDVRGNIMMIFANCDNAAKAQEVADNANAWYGEDHPMTPLVVVSGILFEPPPFPVEKLRKAFPCS
jgi:hypothetical protein